MNTSEFQKKPAHSQDWHPADVVAALRKAGWTMRKLAEHHGYSPAVICAANQKPYPNAERLIAEAIGVQPQEIWPSRYDNRRPRRGQGGAHTHKCGPHMDEKSTSGSRDSNGNGSEGDRQ